MSKDTRAKWMKAWCVWCAGVIIFWIIIIVAHAEDPKPRCDEATGLCGISAEMAKSLPAQHLSDAQLRDYYRYLNDVQAAQQIAKAAQDKLDAAVKDMQATCGAGGIIADAAKGFECKPPEKPSEKAKDAK